MMQQMEGKGYKFLVDFFFLLLCIYDFFFTSFYTVSHCSDISVAVHMALVIVTFTVDEFPFSLLFVLQQ